MAHPLAVNTRSLERRLVNDIFGNRVSVTSQAALRHYDRAVDAQLHAWPGVLEHIDAALTHAPEFALPYALKALGLMARGEASPALAALARAQTCVQRALPREQSQVALVTSILESRSHDALAQVTEHARQYPTDALAASTALGAYGLFGFSGRSDHDAARLAFVDALAPHFPVDFPWLTSYRGWARIETGQVQEGLAMAQGALALRPDNGHNAHIVMHGYFELGASDAALDFLAQWLPTYPEHAQMWGHLQWHAALAEIELGLLDAAVARLLGPITDYLPRGLPFMGLADTVALTWQLGLLGVSGLPWAMVQKHAKRHFPEGSNVFGELHLTLLAAARRDHRAVLASLRRLEKIAQRGHGGAPVAIQFAQGLAALIEGDGDGARKHLDACRADAVCLGGSHAQRRIVEQTQMACRLPLLH